jgi:hypothetical protein
MISYYYPLLLLISSHLPTSLIHTSTASETRFYPSSKTTIISHSNNHNPENLRLKKTNNVLLTDNNNNNNRNLKTSPHSYIIEDTSTDNIWGLDRIDSLFSRSGYYSYDFEGEGVLVYILDSGIDATSLDFDTRVQPGTTYYPPQDVGSAGNSDPYGHGTHVASLVGGTRFGVAKKVTLIPVRILDAQGTGSMDGLIKGLNWVLSDVKSRNAKNVVVNLSLDAPFSTTGDAKIAELQNAGIIVVGAAGNMHMDACMRFPGGSTHLISVGSIATRGTNTGPQVDSISSFSNSGSCVTLLAPGSDIPGAETGQPDGLVVMSGTSMASPHVTGIVALTWNKYPTWSGAQILDRIKRSVAINAIKMDECGPTGNACVTTTNNALVQAPFAEVLIFDGNDIVFTMADFGSSLAYWPQLTGNTKVFGSCSNTGIPPKTGLNSVVGKFAVVDFRQCDSSTMSIYQTAKIIATTGQAIGLIVISDNCRKYGNKILSIPSDVTVDEVDIPVMCVTTSEPSVLKSIANPTTSTVSISLGLVRQLITGSRGTFPWTYMANAISLGQSFQEWRIDWSGTATGQKDNNFCFQFTNRVLQGNPSQAYMMIALASKQHYKLTTTSSPSDVADHRYIVKTKWDGTGSTSLYRDTSNVLNTPSRSSSLSKSHFYFRIGFVSSLDRSWSLEFGNVIPGTSMADGTPILKYYDMNPLLNIDYFSFTSIGSNIGLMFEDIKPCGRNDGELGDYDVEPAQGSGGGGVPPVASPVTSPVSFPPSGSGSGSIICNKIRMKSTCNKANKTGNCGWVRGKCISLSA